MTSSSSPKPFSSLSSSSSSTSSPATTPAASSSSRSALHQQKQITWQHLDPAKFLVLNGFFHFLSDLVLYPPDVVRTRMQVQVLTPGVGNHVALYPIYTSTLDGFLSIIKHEGVRGLYKGFMVAEASYVMGNVFHYCGYEIIKQKLQAIVPSSYSNATWSIFATTFSAGAVADLCAMVFAVPAEVVQQRLQLQGPFMKNPLYSGGLDAMLKIWRSEGLSGLYRGSGATILRTVPASAVWWSTYELAKNRLHDWDLRSRWGGRPRPERQLDSTRTGSQLEDEDPLIHVVAGATASLITTTAMNPIDIAKTRLQTQDMTASDGRITYRSTFSALLHMLRQEGPRSLSKGLVPSLMVSVPAGALSITMYEWVKKLAVN